MPRKRTARRDPDEEKPGRRDAVLTWLLSEHARTVATLIRMAIQVVSVIAGDGGPS